MVTASAAIQDEATRGVESRLTDQPATVVEIQLFGYTRQCQFVHERLGRPACGNTRVMSNHGFFESLAAGLVNRAAILVICDKIDRDLMVVEVGGHGTQFFITEQNATATDSKPDSFGVRRDSFIDTTHNGWSQREGIRQAFLAEEFFDAWSG